MSMNNMYQGYNRYPNNFAQGQGMVPNQVTMPKTGNWLSAEKYALLQKGLSQFKLSVTEEELAKGQCNHYHVNGSSALIPDQDGSGACTCSICGTHFTSREFAQEDVQTSVQNILDILNTIKIMYLSIDPNAALEYFQIIPFIDKIPQLYNIAVNDFKKYEGINTFVPSQTQNPFNIFSTMMGNPMAFAGYAQPVYGAQYGQQPGMVPQMPQMAQQPMMNGFAQQNPQFNPLYGGMPQQQGMGYQPQQQGYAFNPMGAAGMVNTNMPNATSPTGASQMLTQQPVENKDVKVDTQFKK